MKINLNGVFLVLSLSGLCGQSINLIIVDGLNGAALPDAKAEVTYDNPRSLDRYDEQVEFSDSDGNARFSGIGSAGAFLRVTREGYYGFGYPGGKRFLFSSKQLEGGVKKVIRLRPLRDPTALFGKQTEGEPYSKEIPIPALAEWCGYDFEVGDWVAPHGEGETADLLFRFERRFAGFQERRSPLDVRREAIKGKYERLGKEFTEEAFKLEAGNWDMKLEIAFPGEKEGLIRVVEGYRPHSGLRMPHKAPESDYEPSYVYEIKTYGENPRAFRDDVGFFLRTRAVLDENGEIESANYAKTHGDFRFGPDGTLSFTYYFNPVPNDRNLEFDPGKNLFPEGTPGTSNFVLP